MPSDSPRRKVQRRSDSREVSSREEQRGSASGQQPTPSSSPARRSTPSTAQERTTGPAQATRDNNAMVGQAQPSGTSSQNRSTGSSRDLPTSVRHAPPELRLAIRRRQNNESARRARERKKQETEEMYGKIMENSARIDNLEKQVDELSSMLQPGEGKSSSEKKKNKKSSASGSGSGSKSSGHPSSDKKKRFGDPF